MQMTSREGVYVIKYECATVIKLRLLKNGEYFGE